MPHNLQVANSPTNLLLTEGFSLPQRGPLGHAPQAQELPDGGFVSAPHTTILSFIWFCGKRHPREIEAVEIHAYLSYLANPMRKSL